MPYPPALVRTWTIVTGCLFIAGLVWDCAVNSDHSFVSHCWRFATGQMNDSAVLEGVSLAMAALGWALMVAGFAWAVCVPVYAAANHLLGRPPDISLTSDYDEPLPEGRNATNP
jgi:uncharacterized membrane protein